MARQTRTVTKSKATKRAPKSQKRRREPSQDPTLGKKRRVLQRRVETSEEPDQSGPGPSTQRQKTPTAAFFQPGSELQGTQPARQPTEDANSSDEDEDEDDPQKSSERKEFRRIGKAFTLKIWPWTPSEWWNGETRVQLLRTSDVATKIKNMKPQLDAIMRREFVSFVAIEKMLSHEVWMAEDFQSAVIILLPSGFA